jgi:hypothetical protein
MDSLATNVCAFCGAAQPAITPAHAWPSWIRQHFQSTPSPVLQEQTTEVCEPCRNGWLAQLEEPVVPILETAMLTGQTVDWTAADQRALAVWAIKTAMLLELGASAADPFFTDNERWVFMRLQEPPLSDMKVWTAAYRGEDPVRHDATRIKLLRRPAGSHIGDGRVATIAVGRVAFQIAARRFFEPRPHIDDVPFPEEPSRWQDVSIPLWPPSEVPARWPPPRALDGNAFDAFAFRWREGLL